MSATLTTPKTTSGGEIITHLINSTDGTGLHFDGAAGTYVDCGDTTVLDGATRISVEAIFSTTNTSGDVLISKEWTNFCFKLFFDASGTIKFNLGNGIGNATVETSGIYNDGTPKHIVATWDNATLSIYINGNLDGTASQPGGSIPNTADKLALGAYLKADGTNSNNLDGILYRARLWNKSLSQAEVTASYENATVPTADRYGVQGILTATDFTSASGWALEAGTAFDAGNNQIDLTSTANGYGFHKTKTATKVGQIYRTTMVISNHSGGSVAVRVGDMFGTNRSGNGTFTEDITITAAGTLFGAQAKAAGTTLSVDSITTDLVGCVSDYDLAFANPTQSLMVQDRAGAADGTSSATGVVQVTPIEQLNSKSARIGTSAATPADGELAVSRINAGVTANDSQVFNARESGNSRVGIGVNASYGAQLYGPSGTTNPIQLGTMDVSDGGTFAAKLSIDSAGLVSCAAGLAVTGAVTASGAVTGANLNVLNGSSLLARTHSSTSGAIQVLNLQATSSGDMADGFGPSIVFAAADTGTTSAQVAEINAVRAGSDTAFNLEFQTADATRLTISSTGVLTKNGTTGNFEIDAAGNTAVFTYDGPNYVYANAGSSASLKIQGQNAVSISTGASATERLIVNNLGVVKVNGAAGNGYVSHYDGVALTGYIGSGNSLAPVDFGNTDLVFRANNDVVFIASNGTGLADGYQASISGTTGVMTVKQPGWPLKNELTNSGFDVWSNSTLEDVGSDLVTNGDGSSTTGWAAINGATLSATGGKLRITPDGSTANAAATQSVTTVAGKLYKFTFDLDPTVGATTAYCFLKLTGSGTLYTGPTISSAVTNQSIVVEANSSSILIQLFDASATATALADWDNITAFEKTPGCVAADNKAMDGWQRDRDSGNYPDIYRQHNDSTYTKDGSFYSLKVVKDNASREYLYAMGTIYSSAYHYERFAGRTVTFGAWVYSVSATDNVRLGFYDGSVVLGDLVNTADSWVWVEYTYTVSASPTGFTPVITFDGDAADVAYISQPMLVFGSAIGSGNYSKPSGEIVICEGMVRIQSNVSPVAADDKTLNLEAMSDGKIPKGCKAVNIAGQLENSAVTTYDGVLWQATSAGVYQVRAYPLVANFGETFNGLVPCDANGDIYQLVTEPDATLSGLYQDVTAIHLR